ncbi:hypothetical protein COCMIDRAFT_23625 [Bipolaris oryzae ATCC 44560]|uniref:Uncharacterized protein n=1 Tax=Bipolaris oryzae ATCC 44560 TaxID=930090 RepID=W6ZM87_COCMI|nr:uncharacterized protein COCMIDRAFT_23625 [Bipolaris oryzae ATCC 44560]EUC48654.1 hypothetical protein COCMIDRAFT_23625 [Bipolaris oryzae ATCC 44560]
MWLAWPWRPPPSPSHNAGRVEAWGPGGSGARCCIEDRICRHQERRVDGTADMGRAASSEQRAGHAAALGGRRLGVDVTRRNGSSGFRGAGSTGPRSQSAPPPWLDGRGVSALARRSSSPAVRALAGLAGLAGLLACWPAVTEPALGLSPCASLSLRPSLLPSCSLALLPSLSLPAPPSALRASPPAAYGGARACMRRCIVSMSLHTNVRGAAVHPASQRERRRIVNTHRVPAAETLRRHPNVIANGLQQLGRLP